MPWASRIYRVIPRTREALEIRAIAVAADPKPATAVAVVEQPAPDEWERSLEPRSMDDACRLAKRLHESADVQRLRDASSGPLHADSSGANSACPRWPRFEAST